MAYLGSQPLHDFAAELGACDLVADERCNDDFQSEHAPLQAPKPIQQLVGKARERLREFADRLRFASHVQSSNWPEQSGRGAVNEGLTCLARIHTEAASGRPSHSEGTGT